MISIYLICFFVICWNSLQTCSVRAVNEKLTLNEEKLIESNLNKTTRVILLGSQEPTSHAEGLRHMFH